MSVDFSQLAPPQMIETLDYERILNERKTALIERFAIDEQDSIRAILARESEPLTKFVEEFQHTLPHGERLPSLQWQYFQGLAMAKSLKPSLENIFIVDDFIFVFNC